MNSISTDKLFQEGRTFSAWQDKAVSDEALHAIWELMKWDRRASTSSI